MFIDVLKVNKSIQRGFRAIRLHLVHQKIDVNTTVATIISIATAVKPTIKIKYAYTSYILPSLNYYCIQFIVIAILEMLLWWINTVYSHNRISYDLQGHK